MTSFNYIFFLSINIIIFSSAKCYLFSVIMAIYNTGRYLDDSIGSIVNQTIGFTNIQLILINDGSTDNSEEICLKYKNKFNSNIIYSKIEHSGVSISRNIGLKYALGKYINFLDADDKWDLHAFMYVFYFFKFYKNVGIVAGRLKFFETLNSYHPLDYKFYKTRVANLTVEYNCIHISGPSSFFRKSLIKTNNFDKDIFSGEDTIFINNLLLIKPIIGFIREVIYYYRRRADSSSAVQTQSKKIDFYFSQIKLVGEYLLEKSKKLYNQIVPFIQFYLGYNILFRIISLAFKILNNNQYNEYCKIILKLLNEIEDKYILEQKFASSRIKILALSKKYNRDIRYDIYFQNNYLIYSQYILTDFNNINNIIIWRFLEIKDNILHFEGKDNFWMLKEKYYYYCIIGNKQIFPYYLDYSGYDFYTMFGLVNKGRLIIFDIPLEQIKQITIKFFISFMNKSIEIFPSLGYFCHIPTLENGYYSTKKYIIKQIQKRIVIYKYDENLEKVFTNQYYIQLHKLGKDNIIELRKKIIAYNYEKDKYNKKEIWIINDSKNYAGDNGEFFFRYLVKKNNPNIDVYFTINNSSIDYEKLKKIGNILDYGSKEYLFTFLKSNKIISSVSESWATNPFGKDQNYIRDLFNFDIIYLQNRIIDTDLPQSLNRINKNFNLFIASSKMQYNFILSSGYFYNKNNVVYTGLSRFDNLIENTKVSLKEKTILIIPSWRNYIRGTIDLVTYENIYSDTFKNITLFNIYNKFINEQNLISILQQYNYTGILCLHPYFSKQYVDFTKNNYIIIEKRCEYQKLLSSTSLLITDYSNIFYDFGYLKKPIIYFQFDIEEFRKYNYKGCFNFEKDGFGPVCYDIQCVVYEIIKEIKNECKINKKYLKRINKYFDFSDNNNNDRIYFEITKKVKYKYFKIIILYLCMFILFLINIILKLIIKK